MRVIAFLLVATAAIAASIAVFVLLLGEGACDRGVSEKIIDPLRQDLWVATSTGVCTGFGGASWASVDVGRNNETARHVVYSQDDAVGPPRVSWTPFGEIEIHVETTTGIDVSETSVEGLTVRYVIPQRATKESLTREALDWKTRLKADILAGNVDFSGGDVQGNLNNLDHYFRQQQADIDRFVQWTNRVDARVE